MNRASPARSRFLWRIDLPALLVLIASGAVAETNHQSGADFDGRLSQVQIPFVPNIGLANPSVAFTSTTFAGTTYITDEGQIVHSLRSGDAGWTLTETAMDRLATPTRPLGEEPVKTRVSFFLGDDPARWRSNVETYRTVSLGKPWTGISVALRAYGNSVEKLFTVEPGADPALIRMRVDGAEQLRLGRDGALLASTGLGDVSLSAPVAYQEVLRVRRRVPVRYRVQGPTYGFVLGDYEPRLPVVIDPLLQATYLGGSNVDPPGGMAVHPISGNVYVTGNTISIDFPGTAGGAQPVSGGGGDAFVARFNATLTTLYQATYLGGSGEEFAPAVAVHPSSGEIYVAGLTSSANFPGTAGSAQPARAAATDAFVARLNPTLTALSQATYLGGNSDDSGSALAIDPTSGDVYVAGETNSSNFPGAVGGAQPTGGLSDAFVARFNAALTTLQQGTYLGGSGVDYGPALAIHALSGEVYVAGGTLSTDFPGTAGGAQTAIGSSAFVDAFLARLNSTLTTLAQATYLGGDSNDEARDVAVHPASGDVYVTGDTTSKNFPGTSGGAQPARSGGEDTFVARLNSTLTVLAQATYLGGSNIDFASAVALHPTSGDVYVSGATLSTNFPGTAGAAQPAPGGFYDAFVARLSATLTALDQATYLGGSDGDSASAAAIHPISGEVYVAGATDSPNFPGTAGGAQPSSGGETDVFVARLSADLAGGAPPTPTPVPAPAVVPTLSSEMLLLLGVALGSVALLLLRRSI
jgi:hypothetical protein